MKTKCPKDTRCLISKNKINPYIASQRGKGNNVKSLEVYNVKTLEVYNVKTLEVYNVKALEVYNVKTLEVYSIKNTHWR